MSVWVVEQKRSVSSVLQVMRELQTFKVIKQQHRKLGGFTANPAVFWFDLNWFNSYFRRFHDSFKDYDKNQGTQRMLTL